MYTEKEQGRGMSLSKRVHPFFGDLFLLLKSVQGGQSNMWPYAYVRYG